MNKSDYLPLQANIVCLLLALVGARVMRSAPPRRRQLPDHMGNNCAAIRLTTRP